jgi:hypothetical protein
MYTSTVSLLAWTSAFVRSGVNLPGRVGAMFGTWCRGVSALEDALAAVVITFCELGWKTG